MHASPLGASAVQRREISAALQDRIASAMARVAADPKHSKRVRVANQRDADAARSLAAAMRAKS